MNHSLLEEGLSALALPATGVLVDRLAAYIEAIERWNPSHGLVGAAGDELIVKHILDSLAPIAILDRLLAEAQAARQAQGPRQGSVAQARSRSSLADLGTGAGLPGIPLALARSGVDVSLIDRMTRRIHFLEAMKKELPLPNVEIVEAQVEHARGSFDLVVFRAFRPFERKLFKRVFAICAPGGFVAAYKGRREKVLDELGEIDGLHAGVEIVPVLVPGLADERCLVVLRPASRAAAGK
ncbi:MAG: 16S rRNA (guanine(527)-N(7))-methyltransferase RsmG [Spirochaetota bacterium]